MKRLQAVLLALALSSSLVYAEGGKNRGTTGKGTLSTGSSAQGQASQQRSGR